MLSLTVRKKATYGEKLLLVGSTPALGEWALSSAIPLVWSKDHVWQLPSFPLPAHRAPSRLEFKLVLRAPDRPAVWEPGPNHVLSLPLHPADGPALALRWGCPATHCVPAKRNPPAFAPLVEPLLPPIANGQPPAKGKISDVLNAGAVREAYCPVRFSVKYRLQPGEYVCVGGSIAELGKWNKMHAPELTPVSGEKDVCAVEMYLPRDGTCDTFEYKYFVRFADGGRRWEAGENRSADPFGEVGGPRGGLVVWDDRWEKERIELSIYYPLKESEVLHVTGDLPEIGAWFRPGPTAMALGPVEMLETDVEGRKWRLSVWVERGATGFSYRYIVIDGKSGQMVWEREPNRRAEFDGPICNSVRVLRDVNFVSDMRFDKVPPGMLIGPYPQTVDDVDAMAEGGVTGVFNVQTDEDFAHRGVQWGLLMARYKKLGIQVVRFPIRDFDRDSLRVRLHGAAKALDDMLKAGRQVYIHCTAGMGRAPAVAVAYLVWVEKMELMEAVRHVKKYRTVAVPNVPVLEAALLKRY